MSRKSIVQKAAGLTAIVFAALFLLTPVSGAKFSDSEVGRADVSTAKLVLGITDGQGSTGTFDLDYVNLAPGETQSQSITVTNDGSITGDVSLGGPFTNLVMDGGSLTTADLAELTVAIPGHLSSTAVNQLPASIDLGELAPGETKTYEVEVSLAAAAGNEWQDVQLGTDLTVVLEQQ